MSERKFKGICPKCNREIIGTDNWEEGNIVIMGFCEICQFPYSEDEIDFEKNK